jgi:hypothetical protein
VIVNPTSYTVENDNDARCAEYLLYEIEQEKENSIANVIDRDETICALRIAEREYQPRDFLRSMR